MFSSLARKVILCLVAAFPCGAQEARQLAMWHLNWTPGAHAQALAVLDELDRQAPVQLGMMATLSPSSNMAGVTHHRRLAVPGMGMGQILSEAPRFGWRGSAQLALDWQHVLGPGRRLAAGLRVGLRGHQGAWTPTAQLHLTHRVIGPRHSHWASLGADLQGPSRRSLSVAFGQEYALSPRQKHSLSLRTQWDRDPARPYLDGAAITLQSSNTWLARPNLRLDLGWHVTHKQARIIHNGYLGAGVDMRGTWRQGRSTIWDGGLSVAQRHHMAATPGLFQRRRDTDLALDLGMRDPRLRLFGQTPRFGCRYAQTRSTIALYERREMQCGMTFQHRF